MDSTRLFWLGLSALLVTNPAWAVDWNKTNAEILEHFTRLIKIDTSNPPGHETLAARYLQGVLEKEGISVKLVGADPDRLSLVARLKGAGAKKPMLLMGHTDVVGVQRERWTEDPFGARLIDGFIWGRGTLDDKELVVGGLMTILLLKRSGVPLDRDVIFVAESGEEGGLGRAHGTKYGITYLIEHNWPDIDAEFCLTEGGQSHSDKGKVVYQKVQLVEKVRKEMVLVAQGTSGHGSMPREDNPIAHLAAAVAKVAQWQPPMLLNDVTRAYIERLAQISDSEEAARLKGLFDASRTVQTQDYFRKHDIELNSILRTTISPTIISGGFRSNVIPSEAKATLDVRAVPGEDIEAFKDKITRLIGDPQIRIEAGVQEPASPATSMNTEMFRTLEAVQHDLYPGSVLLPAMSTGGSDMSPLRIKGVQCYGIGPEIPKDDLVTHAIHSDNERIGEASLYNFVRYEFQVVAKMAAR
jgi:acetylornithine deacetylase/succinyl-diaminopimelate desuccinylase-like protein